MIMMRFLLIAVVVQVVCGQVEKPYDIDVTVANRVDELDLTKTEEEIEGSIDVGATKELLYVTPLSEGEVAHSIGGAGGFTKELDDDESLGGGGGFDVSHLVDTSNLRGNVFTFAEEELSGGGGTVFNDTFAILGGGYEADKDYDFEIQNGEDGYETLDIGAGGGIEGFNFNIVSTDEDEGGLFSIRDTSGGGGGGVDFLDGTISAGGGGGFGALRAYALPPEDEDIPSGIFKSLSSGGGRGVTIDRDNVFIDIGEGESFDGEVTIEDIDALRTWVINTPAPELKALLLATLP